MVKEKDIFISVLVIFFLINLVFVNISISKEIDLKENTFENSIANWTVMYYLCGDSHLNNETGPLVENLSKIGSTDELNIVLLVDNNQIGDSKLYYINKTGVKVELNKEFGWPDEVDTSDPNTLKLFYNQMRDAYPAKYYGLITFAAGGAGWQAWTLADSHGSYKMLSLPEFADILKDITNDGENKIDVVFTPCIMSMIEVAYELEPYVNYLVTTEEHAPDGPKHYRRFYRATWDLKNNTDMNPEEYANRAPIRHSAHNFSFFTNTQGRLAKLLNKLPYEQLHTIKMHTTSFAVNLSLVKGLVESFNSFVSLLILNQNENEINKATQIARKNVREYGKGYAKFGFSVPIFKYIKYIIHPKLPLEINSYDCYIDLYHFIDIFSNNSENQGLDLYSEQIKHKIDELITAKEIIPGDESHGLSIYFPDMKFLYNRYIFGSKDIPEPYENLRFSKETMWDEFVKDYLGI